MLINLKSNRNREDEKSSLFSDLDALIQEPITFRLFGKLHKIKPISTAEFFKVTNALNKIGELQAKDKVTNEELLEVYVDVFHSVCDSIGRDEVMKMTHAQVLALFDIVVKAITGRIHAELEDVKKNPTPVLSSDTEHQV